MFLPTSQKEMRARGWDGLDVILITGDTYVDSSYIGVAVIGKTLVAAGYRVGIISQPNIASDEDIARLGEPSLFWGVTSGCMDSMIANYTATKKRRKSDDLTAGGKNNKRPDRAVIVYTNLIRRYFNKTVPVIIGGMEASLRRVSHYDYWSDSVRRSILFDAKADILVYGMGEKTIIELTGRIKKGEPLQDVRGICYISRERPDGFLSLPSHAEVVKYKESFRHMFQIFYDNSDPINAKGLCQKQDTRYLIQNRPQALPTTQELDGIYELDYERDAHPDSFKGGPVPALETIRFGLTTHRGCYGECNFCTIAIHQGRTIIERSEDSVLREAQRLPQHPKFKGVIQDVGGPTANMYGIDCERKKVRGACMRKRCLTPSACKHLPVSHSRQIELLKRLGRLPGVKKVFIGSGIRHDLVLQDETYGQKYLEEIIRHHISGQLKIAPEHSEDHILRLMGKPGSDMFRRFVTLYDETNRALKKRQFLTCYFIAAYPGCTMEDMGKLKRFIGKVLKFRPEQIQIFTPSPSTFATMMYYTEETPGGKRLFVEKDKRKKELQKRKLIL
ncbi:conserved hypothetical protein [uncultured Desulfobacterium sp.]|uniref:Radical SAM core domain-containing protein n=1 Tax=uncultured Desulfobacterium sp. TaxID=201089 RepID=A0A445MUU2_9BACT|nr:conserved hypothetical protein [uncultured Desulfobacterium sp.]